MKCHVLVLLGIVLPAMGVAMPVQWDGNAHYYEVVDDPLLGPDAEIAAETRMFDGLQGYLATVTSAEENAFVVDLIAESGVVAALIGASDRNDEGTFTWIGGPEEGTPLSFAPWAPLEPSDSEDGEDYVEVFGQDLTEFGFPRGSWNDIVPPADFFDGARAYVVEYGPVAIAPVPLPAAGWALLAGCGALLAFGRRRRAGVA